MISFQAKPTLKQVFWIYCSLIFNTAASAESEPIFTSVATNQCLAEAYKLSSSLLGHRVLDCVGLSAKDCMASQGGDTTIGMMTCLQREVEFWELRLNTAYSKHLLIADKQDAEINNVRATNISLSNKLKIMQRAWIDYKNAACLYEQAQWLGGSGGGPATIACHMHETARQALKLEGWWPQ
ncbi:lysozyme inhibitor LprI family protein [Vibrio cholerae]|uniref:lysozyme inhibitor LprI family protein n=1 Tax=Vibrio cholerae TaxID=666 RepID=UPI000E6CB9B7|nr:lysozyme inhibitor LprI family protein [Vibrio cholerae]EGQ8442544.1 DUF1311 domain-containing protein [Vibrio cholerae]EGR1312162.1 DUF1311 domain-containing protein [Vibrio cholerae]NOE09209.1 DUF1311 domain-containing protein [Vibrio cholerae]NOF32767.1 DUF1311 domain-containing protein [Vibrio cholerae]RJK82828.1 hypothetical protein CHN45_17095 [Vibrio cholerae]